MKTFLIASLAAAGFQEKDFPNAHIADKCSISLPLYNGMSLEEQDYVIRCVEEISP